MIRRALLLALALVACADPPSTPPSRAGEAFGGMVRGLLGQPLGSAPHVGPPPGGSQPIAPTIPLDAPWTMHTILAGGQGAGEPDGADGLQLGDIDLDGKLDVVSGMEQGLRAYAAIMPHPSVVHQPWPSIELPAVPPGTNLCSPEDAVIGDIDLDGAPDIGAGCETGAVKVTLLFAPSLPNSRNELLNPLNWTRIDLPASAGNRSMRMQIVDVTGDGVPEIVVGGKEANGVPSSIGYYQSDTPRDGASWVYVPIVAAGWVMQMYVVDFDVDGDLDIIYVDKVGITEPANDPTKRGLRLLKSDGLDPPTFTPTQIVNEPDHKWFEIVDWDGDGDLDVTDCRSGDGSPNEFKIWINGGAGSFWTSIPVDMPANVGECLQLTARDLDQDGDLDLAATYAQATNLSGLTWMRRDGPALSPTFERGEISGILDVDSDVKFDNLIWIDVDLDGDLDALSTEQHIPGGGGPGAGLVWFENPLIQLEPVAPEPAVACTLLTAGSTTTDGTSASTAPIQPGANRAVLAGVTSCNSGGPVVATMSGNGLTWDLAGSTSYAASNARRLTVRRAMGSAPTSEPLTFDFGVQTQTCFAWVVVECTGVDTSGSNGSGAAAEVTTASSGASTVTTIHTSLGAFPDERDRNVTFTALNIVNTVSPDLEFLELADVSVGSGSAAIEAAEAAGEEDADPTFSVSAAAQISARIRIAP